MQCCQGNQNSPVLPPSMHHQDQHTSVGVCGHLGQGHFMEAPLLQGRDFGLSQAQCGINSSSRPGNLSEFYRMSTPAMNSSYSHCAPSQQQRVNASSLICPIMMLTNPNRVQTDQSRRDVALLDQHSPDPGAVHTQLAAATADRAEPYQNNGAQYQNNGAQCQNNGAQSLNNGAQHPSNGAQYQNNAEPYLNNGAQYQNNAEPYPNNGTWYQNIAEPYQNNGAQYQNNGAQYRNNGEPYQNNAEPYQNNGAQYQNNAEPYPNNGAQYPNNGAQYQNNGAQYQNIAEPYPNNGAQYQNRTEPYPNNGAQYQNRAEPYPNNGTWYQNNIAQYQNNHVQHQNSAAPYQNTPGATHMQLDATLDSAAPYQNTPGATRMQLDATLNSAARRVKASPPAGSVYVPACPVLPQNQSTFNINGGQFGRQVSLVRNRYLSDEADSRQHGVGSSTDYRQQLPMNTNLHFPQSHFRQRQHSTAAETNENSLDSDVLDNTRVNAQLIQGNMHPFRQLSQTDALFNSQNNQNGGLYSPKSGQDCPPALANPRTNPLAEFGEDGLVGSHHLGRSLNFPCQRLEANGCYSDYIQWEVKEDIKRSLHAGRVIQVCGPPMAGKSTVVKQAVREAASQCHPWFPQHHIYCKKATNYQQFLSLVARKICPQHNFGPEPDEDMVLEIINSALQPSGSRYCVFVFHKCENLHDTPDRKQFLNFLTTVACRLAFPVTVLFTTYMLYSLPKNKNNVLVTVGTLSIHDIIMILSDYAPDVDVVSYSKVLEKSFCFPEAVRLIVEEFIVDEKSRATPEALEKKIHTDHRFMSQLFECHLQEVQKWVPNNILSFLLHFGHSIENSFTEAHLEYVNSAEMDQIDLNKTLCYLKQNHVVRLLPTINRLMIHPLVVYYLMTSFHQEKQLLPQKWFDNTCNRHSHFVGRVLMSAEANMQEQGRKGLVFGCVFEEWPSVRYLIQAALHCNQNTYENFMKVAVSASGLIIKFFPREAESFYWSMYTSARDLGTPCEFAVMECLLGQAVAEGSGKDWSKADKLLTSAIQRLSQFGNSYYLGIAYVEWGIIRHRQGKYEESKRILDQSKKVLQHVDRHALGESFYVSEAKVEEQIITQEIHKTIPYIFTGQNQLARQRLKLILDLIQSNCENHPELATVLNLIGLTEQRGNKDLQQALRWYKLSYSERMYFAKMCPEKLLAVLNNIGMILFHQGDTEECVKYLHKALDIQRETGWTHYYTGLTLLHLAEIHMKKGNCAEAFKRALEAQRIFAATVKDHDVRLRVQFILAHLRIVLRQALEERECSIETMREHFKAGRCSVGQERSNHLGAGRCSVGQEHSDHLGATSSQYDCSNTHADIVSVTTTKIEPCDLLRSAEDYLHTLISIAASMEGTLSDDGLTLVLCSIELLMLLNYGNPVKFEEHKTAFIKFSQDNPWMEQNETTSGADAESKYRSLFKHKEIALYIMNTPYANIDVATFIEYMQNVCLTCLYAKRIFNADLWMAEVYHCMQKRQRNNTFMQLDLLGVTTQMDSLTSEDARNHVAVHSENCPEAERPGLQKTADLGNIKPGRSSSCAVDVVPTGRGMLSEFAPNRDLMSYSQKEDNISALHFQDGDRCKHMPCHSNVSRIANDQQYIFNKIRSCPRDGCLTQTVGVDLEASSAAGGKTSSGTRTTAHADQPAPREPVEQTYLGDQDPDWNNDDSFHSLNERDISLSYEMYQLGHLSSEMELHEFSPSERQPDPDKANTCMVVEGKEFSAADYILNCVTENMVEPDQSENSESHQEKPAFSKCLSAKGMPVNQALDVDGGPVMPNKTVDLTAYTLRQPKGGASHSENGSQLTIVFGQKVLQPQSECSQRAFSLRPQHNESTGDSEHDDSGQYSSREKLLVDSSKDKRLSESESSLKKDYNLSQSNTVSQRLRNKSSSSSGSGRHGAPAPESGYSSQNKMSKSPQNVTTTSTANPSAMTSHCTTDPRNASKRQEHANEGFSEIQNNVPNGFHEESHGQCDK